MTLPYDSRYAAASTLAPDFSTGQFVGIIELDEEQRADEDVWESLVRSDADDVSARDTRSTERVWADLDRLHDDLAAELQALRRRWLDARG